tara:strand:+ start:203 stop:505 length:303 start_codon:yes stop_codon:yes gene_type:complete
MGSWSDTEKCPNCNQELMETHGSTKIFEGDGYMCFGCGIYNIVQNRQMNLEELNWYRKDYNENYLDEDDEQLEMLTELPPLDEQLTKWVGFEKDKDEVKS